MVGLARQIYFYEKQGNLYQNRGLEESDTEDLRDLRGIGGSEPRRRLETDIKKEKMPYYISIYTNQQIEDSAAATGLSEIASVKKDKILYNRE